MRKDEFAERLGQPDLSQRTERGCGFDCRERQGSLWELADGPLVQHPRRVGHLKLS